MTKLEEYTNLIELKTVIELQKNPFHSKEKLEALKKEIEMMEEFYIKHNRRFDGIKEIRESHETIISLQKNQRTQQDIDNQKKIDGISSYLYMILDGDPESENPQDILNMIDCILLENEK